MLIFILAVLVLSILVAFLAIVLVNLAVLPRLDEGWEKKDETLQAASQPSLAVLVPARNEEINIEECLGSLLAQDYPNLEIWVYDDASTDRTAEIVERIQSAIRLRPSSSESAIYLAGLCCGLLLSIWRW